LTAQARERFAAGDAASAATLARQALEQDASADSARIALALALRELDDLPGAFDVLSRAGELCCRDTHELCALAELLLEGDDAEWALLLLERGREMAPEAVDVAEMLCELYLEEGRHEAVVAVAEPLADRSDASLRLREALLSSWEHQGDLQRAERLARQLVLSAPLEGYAQFRLATLEQRTGQAAQAIARYLLVLELGAVDPDLQGAAEEAVDALDAVQLQQIAALASASVVFRVGLNRDCESTLRVHGFHLSDPALAALRSMDLEELAHTPVHVDRRMSH
jgi:tetratricopeptide (TPR) repeat protein